VASGYKLFVSYCHDDEYLQEEFRKHCSALVRNKRIGIWYDRCILAGELLGESIDDNLLSSDVVVLLVSSSFINSDYCVNKEYQTAKLMHSEGTARLVPIIVRECDFDFDELSKFNIAPRDAKPVNPPNAGRSDVTLRDTGWTKAINELKRVLDRLDEDAEMNLNDVYRDSQKSRFSVDSKSAEVQLKDIFVEPEIYLSNSDDDRSFYSIQALAELAQSSSFVLGGEDRSGKSVLLYATQRELIQNKVPCVILDGRLIKSYGLEAHIKKLIGEQIACKGRIQNGSLVVLIDDLDEGLKRDHDRVEFLRSITSNYKSVGFTCFSQNYGESLVSLLTEDFLTGSIKEFPTPKIYEFAENWLKATTLAAGEEETITTTLYKNVMQLNLGGAIPLYPATIVTLLQVIDAAGGADVSAASNAACYNQLVDLRLIEAGVSANDIDASKLMLGLLAGSKFENYDIKTFNEDDFTSCIEKFKADHFASLEKYRLNILQCGLFELISNGEGTKQYRFKDRFIGYLLIALYFEKILKSSNKDRYETEILKLLSALR